MNMSKIEAAYDRRRRRRRRRTMMTTTKTKQKSKKPKQQQREVILGMWCGCKSSKSSKTQRQISMYPSSQSELQRQRNVKKFGQSTHHNLRKRKLSAQLEGYCYSRPKKRVPSLKIAGRREKMTNLLGEQSQKLVKGMDCCTKYAFIQNNPAVPVN